VPDERRKKLVDKSRTFILIGYHPTGVYHLYDLVNHNIMINRDVVIHEGTIQFILEDKL